MTFSSPRFSPWQQAALDVAKAGGTIIDVIDKIQDCYPFYTASAAAKAANVAIQAMERKNVLYRDGGTLRLVTTEKPAEANEAI